MDRAEPGAAPTYQWYRNGAAISKATKATFQLSSVDLSKLISVKITLTKLNYTTVAATSVPANYTIIASGAPVIDVSGGVVVGFTLGVLPRTFKVGTTDVSDDVDAAYQWYRNGVAITLPTPAIDPSYTLQEADLGKTITVRVTTTLAGRIPTAGTSAATFAVANNFIEGWNALANVTVSKTVTTSIVLTAGPSGATSSADPGDAQNVTAYQWFRDSTAIAAATHVTYALVAADAGHSIWVREIVTRASGPSGTFAPVLKTSVPRNYTVTATGLPTISDTTPTRGQQLTASLPASYSLPIDDVTLDPSTLLVDPTDATVVTFSGIATASRSRGRPTRRTRCRSRRPSRRPRIAASGCRCGSSSATPAISRQS